jgi:hypothetical protein
MVLFILVLKLEVVGVVLNGIKFEGSINMKSICSLSLFVLLCLIISSCELEKNKSVSEEEGALSEGEILVENIILEVQDEIRKRLEKPDTAKFSNLKQVYYESQNTFWFCGIVDSVESYAPHNGPKYYGALFENVNGQVSEGGVTIDHISMIKDTAELETEELFSLTDICEGLEVLYTDSYLEELINYNKSQIARNYKDPYSIKIEDLKVWYQRNVGELHICANINAKNSFGAYTGAKPIYLKSVVQKNNDHKVTEFVSSDKMTAATQYLCSGFDLY